jgi:hypothetical protein
MLMEVEISLPPSAQLHFDSGLSLSLAVYRARGLPPAPVLFDSCRVERAANTARAVAEDVGVDHGRGNVAMTEELLHGADVMAAPEQMRGEGMALMPRAA